MLRRSADKATRWGATALGATVMLVASACGSTVQWSNAIPEGGSGEGVTEGGLSLADPGTEAERTSPEADAATLGKLDDSTGTQTGIPGTQTGIPGTQTGMPGTRKAPRPGTTGRGFTEKLIYVGYSTAEDSARTLRTLGFDAASGSHEAQAKAVADDINARGGVAGRKIVPVIHDFNTAQVIQDPNGAMQAACEYWTVDRPVLAVINHLGVGGDETLIACLASRQTPVVPTNVTITRPQRMFSRYAPYLYAPNQPTIDRLVPAWMKRAAANGYFNGWDTRLGRPGSDPTKIGILTWRQYGAEFTRIVRKELSRQRKSVAATFEGSGNLDTVSNEMNQAVLRFQRAGVTHVIVQSNQLNFFSPAAAAQNYRPRYALTSSAAPIGLPATAPEGQLAGALGVGYMPTRDVDDARDPGDVSAAQTRCRKVMKQAGQDTSARNAWSLMVRACDGLNFIAAAIGKGGLSPAGMQRGAQAMGSMPSASTFRISFPRGRFTGASAVRDLAYRDDCSCFAYLTSKNHGM